MRIFLAALLIVVSNAAGARPNASCYQEVECQILEKACGLTDLTRGHIEAAYTWRERYHFVCQDRNGSVYQTDSFVSAPVIEGFVRLNVFEAMDACKYSSQFLTLCPGLPEAP